MLLKAVYKKIFIFFREIVEKFYVSGITDMGAKKLLK